MMPILAILEYSLYLLLGMWNKFFQCLCEIIQGKKGNVHSSINNVLNDHEPGPFKHFYESKGEDF